MSFIIIVDFRVFCLEIIAHAIKNWNYCYQAKLESLANWYNTQLNMKVGGGTNEGVSL